MRVFYRRHMLSAFLTPNHTKHPSLAEGNSRYQWDKQIKQQVHNFMSCTKEIVHEKFWDTKGVIWICKSKMDKQHNGQKKRTKEQTTIYKPLHRKLKIEHHQRTNLVSFSTEWSIKLSTVVDIEKNQNRSGKNSETLQESSPNKILSK